MNDDIKSYTTPSGISVINSLSILVGMQGQVDHAK